MRDKYCVYCHVEMHEYPHIKGTHKDQATLEHFNFDGPFDWINGKEGLKKEDFAYCCGSCNSSRGKKDLRDWFKTPYCTNGKTKINADTVAKPVREYLKRNPPKLQE